MDGWKGENTKESKGRGEGGRKREGEESIEEERREEEGKEKLIGNGEMNKGPMDG